MLTELRAVIASNEQASPMIDIALATLNKIVTRQAVVAIVGLGYVGLPLAVAFAEARFRVVGIDIDARRISSLNAGQSYIPDVSAHQVSALLTRSAPNGQRPMSFVDNRPDGEPAEMDQARQHGSLYATTDYDILHHVDAAIVCVPTPVSAAKEPDLSYILSAVNEIAPRLHQEMLIVLESTTYPGTTEEVVLPRLEQSGLSVGTDFFLAFSPERIDPGRTDWTVYTTPKVLGGVTPTCLKVAQALYECAINHVVPVSNARTAEMVKLLENTFRAVNIGLANEMAMMCDRLDIDVWEVIEAAKSKPYGFMPFYPGPGVGGHCIPVDPLYLAWKLRVLNYEARFIQTAHQINVNMPHYVLAKITEALNEDGKPLNGSRILVFGVAYKADVNDVRESPALELIPLLRRQRAEVVYNDPYVPSLVLDGLTLTSITLNDETLRQADCIVILAAHQCYDWAWVMEHGRLVVDTRNVLRNGQAHVARVVKL
jgi:UDP-N-acetyl-D-glucosamine dehydrogenase